jgi:hypothetical protein
MIAVIITGAVDEDKVRAFAFRAEIPDDFNQFFRELLSYKHFSVRDTETFEFGACHSRTGLRFGHAACHQFVRVGFVFVAEVALVAVRDRDEFYVIAAVGESYGSAADSNFGIIRMGADNKDVHA